MLLESTKGINAVFIEDELTGQFVCKALPWRSYLKDNHWMEWPNGTVSMFELGLTIYDKIQQYDSKIAWY